MNRALHRIFFAMFFCVYCSHGQRIDSIQVIDLENNSTGNNLAFPKVFECDTSLVWNSLNTGYRYAKMGNYLLWGGLGLQLFGFLAGNSATISEAAFHSLIAGSCMLISAPILACRGGDIATKGMQACYHYGGHKGWHYYRQSGLLFLSDIALVYMGGYLASKSQSKILDVSTIAIGLGVGISGWIFYFRSILSPYSYVKNARSIARAYSF